MAPKSASEGPGKYLPEGASLGGTLGCPMALRGGTYVVLKGGPPRTNLQLRARGGKRVLRVSHTCIPLALKAF